MKELSEVVSNKINSMINNGAVEEMISDEIEKTIKSCIEQSMKSYGDFGRSIKDKIEESLNISIGNITIPEYNKYIQEIINENFITILKQDSVDHLKKLVGDIVKPVAKESSFSEIIDMVREIWGGEENVTGIKINERTSDDDQAIYVTFHHPEFDFYDVKIVLYNFNHSDENLWHIGYIEEEDRVITTRTTCIAQSTNRVTDMLFKYYAMGTKFKADEEFCDIDLYDN